MGVRKIAPEENCPPVRVRIWVGASFRIASEFSSETIVLEPLNVILHPSLSMQHISFCILENFLVATFSSGKHLRKILVGRNE